MKRVLHLIDTVGPGGAETIFISLARGLDKDAWASFPVVQGPGWVQDSLRSHGFNAPVVASRRALDVVYVRELRRIIQRLRIDLVHGHLLSSALYGGLAAKLAGIPTVATLHGIPDLQDRKLKYHILRHVVERTIFVSRSLRETAIAETGLRAGDTAVIYNGIDADEYRPRTKPGGKGADHSGRLIVGAVGNVRPLKDYPNLLKAAALVEAAAPGRCKFVIAGSTRASSISELLEIRQTLNLDQSLEFLGFQEDIAEFLRTLDIFVLSSSSEGFSLATVQAMATGLPVVATRSGGPEEIISHGDTGVLVPAEDPQELAGGILKLASDPELMARLGRNGRQAVEHKFSLDAMIGGYDRLYRDVLFP